MTDIGTDVGNMVGLGITAGIGLATINMVSKIGKEEEHEHEHEHQHKHHSPRPKQKDFWEETFG